MAGWEAGTSSPSARHRRPLSEQLSISLDELDHLLDPQQLVVVNGHEVPEELGLFASLEQAAARLQTFEPLVLPALLQTRDYALGTQRAYFRPLTDGFISDRVDLRMASKCSIVGPNHWSSSLSSTSRACCARPAGPPSWLGSWITC